MSRLVFLDTETTGLDPAKHEVWEIAYAVDDGPVLSSVVWHDSERADPAALAMNGYAERYGEPRTWSLDDIVAAGGFERDLREALTGATLVGANPAFDAAFLKARWGAASWRYRLLDVEAYAMGALGFDEPKGLAKIAEALGVQAPDHSAAQDVRTLRECFRILRNVYTNPLSGFRRRWITGIDPGTLPDPRSLDTKGNPL